MRSFLRKVDRLGPNLMGVLVACVSLVAIAEGHPLRGAVYGLGLPLWLILAHLEKAGA